MTLSEKILHLKWFEINKIELSPILSKPCLFITVMDDCLGSFRSSMGMIPGDSNYYDPRGLGTVLRLKKL